MRSRLTRQQPTRGCTNTLLNVIAARVSIGQGNADGLSTYHHGCGEPNVKWNDTLETLDLLLGQNDVQGLDVGFEVFDLPSTFIIQARK